MPPKHGWGVKVDWKPEQQTIWHFLSCFYIYFYRDLIVELHFVEIFYNELIQIDDNLYHRTKDNDTAI